MFVPQTDRSLWLTVQMAHCGSPTVAHPLWLSVLVVGPKVSIQLLDPKANPDQATYSVQLHLQLHPSAGYQRNVLIQVDVLMLQRCECCAVHTAVNVLMLRRCECAAVHTAMNVLMLRRCEFHAVHSAVNVLLRAVLNVAS